MFTALLLFVIAGLVVWLAGTRLLSSGRQALLEKEIKAHAQTRETLDRDRLFARDTLQMMANATGVSAFYRGELITPRKHFSESETWPEIIDQ